MAAKPVWKLSPVVVLATVWYWSRESWHGRLPVVQGLHEIPGEHSGVQKNFQSLINWITNFSNQKTSGMSGHVRPTSLLVWHLVRLLLKIIMHTEAPLQKGGRSIRHGEHEQCHQRLSPHRMGTRALSPYPCDCWWNISTQIVEFKPAVNGFTCQARASVDCEGWGPLESMDTT